MLTMDVFNDNAFSATSLSTSVDKMDFNPSLLESIDGLFEKDPVTTEEIWIEERTTGAIILPTSPRGSNPHRTGGDRRTARNFQTVRIADSSRIKASELQGIRAFGSETLLQSLQTEVARRQLKIKRNFARTWENLRLGAVLGTVKDSDGSTIYNWATEFSQSIPTEVDFDLDNASPAEGVLRGRCTAAIRSITRGLKGVGEPRRIIGICGDAFWDSLIAHPEVVNTYQGWSAAADLRGQPLWEFFRFGGIDWINYRSVDPDDADTSTGAAGGTSVNIPTAEAKIFPVGAGIFRWAQSPGETFDTINLPGQDTYSMVVRDLARNAWVDIEVYSYPLPVCTMPGALYKARRT